MKMPELLFRKEFEFNSLLVFTMKRMTLLVVALR